MSEQLASVTSDQHQDLPLWLAPPAGVTAARRREAPWSLVRAISDVVALGLAALVMQIWAAEPPGTIWQAVAIPLALAGLVAAGGYASRLRLDLAAELVRVVGVSAVSLLALSAAARVLPLGPTHDDAAANYWLLASALLAAGRVAIQTAQYTARVHARAAAPTLIVGAGQVGHRVAKRLIDHPHLGLAPIGFLDKEPLLGEDLRPAHSFPTLPVLGASWDLEEVVEAHQVERVVIAFSTAPHEVLLDIVRRCWSLGVEVMLVPRLYEVEGRRLQVDHVGALPLVAVGTSDPRGRRMAIKYGIDRLVGLVIVLCLAPLLAMIAVAVLVSTGRPILFRQRRVGLDGKVFDMLKFRTMRGAPDRNGEADAQWAALALGYPAPTADAAVATDDRRTAVGRILRAFSLDELPQLWNVLRGDMSLVGPRPERVQYVERFQHAVYRYPDRHRVKAGLTGWAQIHGLRGETSLEDRIEWDNFYIENWSFWLDLRILVMTLPALVTRRGG